MTGIGHNQPPSPVEDAIAPFQDALAEAEHWLDGELVEDAGQMAAVDALIVSVKAAAKAVDAARDEATKPLHAAWKAEVAAWKPQQDELARVVKALVACVGPFRKAEAERAAEKSRAAKAEAERAAHAAKMAAIAADPANIEEQRRAAALADAAQEAAHSASEAAQGRVKGLRAVTLREVTNYGSAINWIAKNDKDAIRGFVDAYAAKRTVDQPMDGVNIWQEKRAF